MMGSKMKKKESSEKRTRPSKIRTSKQVLIRLGPGNIQVNAIIIDNVC